MLGWRPGARAQFELFPPRGFGDRNPQMVPGGPASPPRMGDPDEATTWAMA